jgi:hypothetical protein
MRQEKQQAIQSVMMEAKANLSRSDILTLSLADFLFIGSLYPFL